MKCIHFLLLVTPIVRYSQARKHENYEYGEEEGFRVALGTWQAEWERKDNSQKQI